jgi:HEAT repeat protein
MFWKLSTLLGLLLVLSRAVPVCAETEDVRLRKVLKILAEDKSSKRRQAAALALEAFGPRAKGVLIALTDALQKDTSAEVRRTAAQVLGQMGEDARTAIPALVAALRQDKSESVREMAARALGGKMAPFSKVAVLALGEALADPSPGTRAAAAETLSELGVEARPAMRPLLDALKDPKAGRFTHLYAIQALSRFKADSDEIVPALLSAFEHGADGGIRQAAAEGLARFGPEAGKAASALADVLGNAKAPLPLRRTCAVALLRIGADAKTAWPAVQAALTDPDATLRSQAVRLAGPLGKEERAVVPALVRRCLEDGNVEVRLAAIQELGQLGPAAKDAAKVLHHLARNDSRASIRNAAQASLKKIEGGE